jgi:hypothetical protein
MRASNCRPAAQGEVRFEIPFIMSDRLDLSGAVPEGADPVRHEVLRLRAAASGRTAGKQYFVAWHKAADSDIGHMICITLAGGSAATSTIAKLKFDYYDGVCEVWERPDAGGAREEPWCTFDLASGAQGEFVGGKK